MPWPAYISKTNPHCFSLDDVISTVVVNVNPKWKTCKQTHRATGIDSHKSVVRISGSCQKIYLAMAPPPVEGVKSDEKPLVRLSALIIRNSTVICTALLLCGALGLFAAPLASRKMFFDENAMLPVSEGRSPEWMSHWCHHLPALPLPSPLARSLNKLILPSA